LGQNTITACIHDIRQNEVRNSSQILDGCSNADKAGYQKMMREARIDLTKRGIYDKRMMKLLWQFRCKQDPKNFECALQEENYK
jgi:hypothetical protein